MENDSDKDTEVEIYDAPEHHLPQMLKSESRGAPPTPACQLPRVPKGGSTKVIRM